MFVTRNYIIDYGLVMLSLFDVNEMMD